MMFLLICSAFMSAQVIYDGNNNVSVRSDFQLPTS
jgi:hypothetical protein